MTASWALFISSPTTLFPSFLLSSSFSISLVHLLELLFIKLNYLSAEITFKNTFCEYHHIVPQYDGRVMLLKYLLSTITLSLSSYLLAPFPPCP